MKAPASKGDRRLLETGFYWRIYGNSGATGSGPTRKRSLTTALAHQPYEKYLKKSIPFVSLCLDNHRNIVVDSIISNVYVKIPDSSVSGQEILSPKLGAMLMN